MQARHFNKFFKKHLLSEFPGYVNTNRGDLFAVPMNHLWRGFAFSPSSSPECFFFGVNIIPLYDGPQDVLYVGIGGRLRDGSIQSWEWTDANEQEIMGRLHQAMKSAEKQTLDRIRLPLDYAKAALAIYQETKSTNHLRQSAFSFIQAGEFDAAVPLLEEFCQYMEKQRSQGEPKEMHHILGEKIFNLMKTDPKQAQAQLLEWEQQTKKNLKLEKYPN